MPRRAHYVLSTHWDREWYQPFQDFRYRLVQLLDRALAGIEDGRMRGPFTTDGQSILLEDYLEIRPERREQIARLARERKLVVGPWYVLPDQWLVSGEAIVRNLQMGRAVARSFGAEPSNAGFACDLFGHVSQLPQIFAGFGIGMAFIWRGNNVIDHRLIRWRGADGTELPTFRFPMGGYVDYAIHVRRAHEHRHPHDPQLVARQLEAYFDTEAAATPAGGPLLLFDGGDHMEWDERAYPILADRLGTRDGVELVHTDLDAFAAEAAAFAHGSGLMLEGELRESARHPNHVEQQWLIPGVLSSRVWIKQANVRCQNLLCHWAEPMPLLAHAALGSEYPTGFLTTAWRWLLQNHPHDSICGCSIDQVHEDMKYRFSQCRQIGERLTTRALRDVTAAVAGDVGDRELRVGVFNPLPRAFGGVADLTLQIPSDWPTFGEFFQFEQKPAFRVYDAEGREVPYQLVGQQMGRTRYRSFDEEFPAGFATNDVRVALRLDVPPVGYTTLTVRAGERVGGDAWGAAVQPTRHPVVPSLVRDHATIANEHVEVRVAGNGTVSLVDRATGHRYDGLLNFEDAADIGDGWFHGPAVNDRVCASLASAADVSIDTAGPLLATIRVTTHLRVPRRFDFAAMRRADETVDLAVESRLTLRAGSRHVEVETSLVNAAEDHRLRVILPTGAGDATTYLADSAFDVVEREIARSPDNHLYREPEVETRPQHSWTAVSAGGRGLAVLAEGLHETAILDVPERPIALTLFRATRKTYLTNGEPGGQLLGPLAFRYWITPLAGPPDRIEMFTLAQRLGTGLRDAQLARADMHLFRDRAAALPRTASLLGVGGDVVVTALRQVGGEAELRFFNPGEADARAAVCLGEAMRGGDARWRLVDFDGRPMSGWSPANGGAFDVPCAAKQIRTVRIANDPLPKGQARHA